MLATTEHTKPARYCILVYSPAVDAPPVATIISCGNRKEACDAARVIALSKPYHITKLLDLVHLTATRIN